MENLELEKEIIDDKNKGLKIGIAGAVLACLIGGTTFVVKKIKKHKKSKSKEEIIVEDENK